MNTTPQFNEEDFIKKMKEEIQEHGDMHGEFCLVNMEDPDECECEEMSFWGGQIEKYVKQALFSHNQKIVEMAKEIASDPPTESNERRRGFQEFADEFITRINNGDI